MLPWCHISNVKDSSGHDDPVPLVIRLSLEQTFRVLEAIEDARLVLREHNLALGLQDELATVIRMIHDKLGLDEGGTP